MFHCASITHSRLHAAVGPGYFRTIFPRIKQGGSLLLWCGDGMTGRANQALIFSVNMFYSFGVRASPPFFCISHWGYYSLHLAAENLSSSRWNKMNSYSMWAGRTHLGHLVLPLKSIVLFNFVLLQKTLRSPYNWVMLWPRCLDWNLPWWIVESLFSFLWSTY